VTARAVVAAAAARRHVAERARLAATADRLHVEAAAIRKSRRKLNRRALTNRREWRAYDAQVEKLEAAEAALRGRGAPLLPERSTLG